MRGCLRFLLLIVALLYCTVAVLGYAEDRLNDNYKLLPTVRIEGERTTRLVTGVNRF